MHENMGVERGSELRESEAAMENAGANIIPGFLCRLQVVEVVDYRR